MGPRAISVLSVLLVSSCGDEQGKQSEHNSPTAKMGSGGEREDPAPTGGRKDTAQSGGSPPESSAGGTPVATGGVLEPGGSGGLPAQSAGGSKDRASGGQPGSGGQSTHPSPQQVLIFTKTAGYRHGSIPAGIAALEGIANARGWETTASEDSAIVESLARFSAVVFLSTTGDIFDAAEQETFRAFIENGGAFVGIHAATDTEPDWAWYREFLGAHFDQHPDIQEASIVVEDLAHPATAHLDSPWVRSDEWYNFDVNPRDVSHVLLSLDETSYQGGTMGDHPIAWTREVGTSRLFYTGLGHTEQSYSDSAFLSHLEGGLAWVLEDEPDE